MIPIQKTKNTAFNAKSKSDVSTVAEKILFYESCFFVLLKNEMWKN